MKITRTNHHSQASIDIVCATIALTMTAFIALAAYLVMVLP